jgi:dipeptidyl aminopeptidase/acylaminoacyl peptidase
LANLGGSDRATPLYQARSGVASSQPEWSPDGSKIAFVSDRGAHSFIAVYDFGVKSLSYTEPTVDRDGDPVWSLDGKQVAFIRIAFGGRANRAPSKWPALPMARAASLNTNEEAFYSAYGKPTARIRLTILHRSLVDRRL